MSASATIPHGCVCPSCGQPILPERLRLSPIRQRILDAVQCRPGISAEELRCAVWCSDPSGGPENRKCIHAHVWAFEPMHRPIGFCRARQQRRLFHQEGSMNWKDKGDGRFEALASREVGGKYFIEWHEGHYSNQINGWLECGQYGIDYQWKGGGGRGNVNVVRGCTIELAKAIAEKDHEERQKVIREFGAYVPYEAWDRFHREMLAWQQALEAAP